MFISKFLKHCVRIFTYPVFSPFCTLHVSWNPVHTTYIYIWCSDRAIAIVEPCGVKKKSPSYTKPLRQYKNLSSIYHHLKQQTIALHNMLTHFHTCTIRHRTNKITISICFSVLTDGAFCEAVLEQHSMLREVVLVPLCFVYAFTYACYHDGELLCEVAL